MNIYDLLLHNKWLRDSPIPEGFILRFLSKCLFQWAVNVLAKVRS